jgi:hypothetical protein
MAMYLRVTNKGGELPDIDTERLLASPEGFSSMIKSKDFLPPLLDLRIF